MPSENSRPLYFKLGLSFFLFGLINNLLYVIVLSAALDLVPPSTPKGIIAFCNIAPAFAAKLFWPYLLKGSIRYERRVAGCCFLSVSGMIIVASFEGLTLRLLGVCFASFASGLGELTFLQLSTAYAPSLAGHSVGYFASGTGAAGLVGAFLWWELRNLGVRTGVGISSVMPLITPVTYYFLLPRQPAFSNLSNSYDDNDYETPSTAAYAPLATDEDLDVTEVVSSKLSPVQLAPSDKWRLLKPMILKYMLPLFCVYLFEYTINQGIGPTLIYPVPSSSDHPIMSLIIHSLRDYYPLWQLVYQTTVFLSRSSISLGFPALPTRFISAPAIVQLVILLMLMYESGLGIFNVDSEGASFLFVFLLISVEGFCGGLAYVNVFYRVNQEPPDPLVTGEVAKQEKEFKIGSIGFSDSSGILVASLVAVPMELMLCNAQVTRGKALCRTL